MFDCLIDGTGRWGCVIEIKGVWFGRLVFAGRELLTDDIHGLEVVDHRSLPLYRAVCMI